MRKLAVAALVALALAGCAKPKVVTPQSVAKACTQVYGPGKAEQDCEFREWQRYIDVETAKLDSRVDDMVR